jgi:hypothetical protein
MEAQKTHQVRMKNKNGHAAQAAEAAL